MQNEMLGNAKQVAIFVRVSTSRQETARQINELQSYAKKMGYGVAEVVEESISGAARMEQRQGINRILELAHTGQINKVLVHEVSRLARKNSVAHQFIEELEALGVSLYWHTQKVETLLPCGKRNPASAIMFALLAEMARNERETLSARVKSGLKEAKRRGVTLGRPAGSILTEDEKLEKHKDIVKLLKQGHSLNHASKISGKGYSTVARIRALMLRLSML